jgi:hypothetical protein
MPVRVNPDLPESDVRLIAETETDFAIAIDIPKATIATHRRFLEMLLEAVAGGGNDG